MKKNIVALIVLIGLILVSCNQKKEKEEEEKKWSTPSSSIKKRNNRFDAGKLVYDRNCKACHQANRMGIPKVFPPLKNTKRVVGDKDYLINILLNGMSEEIVVEGIKYKGVMASYRNLSNQEIADVINYIRSDSEAIKDLVTAKDVESKR